MSRTRREWEEFVIIFAVGMCFGAVLMLLLQTLLGLHPRM